MRLAARLSWLGRTDRAFCATSPLCSCIVHILSQRPGNVNRLLAVNLPALRTRLGPPQLPARHGAVCVVALPGCASVRRRLDRVSVFRTRWSRTSTTRDVEQRREARRGIWEDEVFVIALPVVPIASPREGSPIVNSSTRIAESSEHAQVSARRHSRCSPRVASRMARHPPVKRRRPLPRCCNEPFRVRGSRQRNRCARYTLVGNVERTACAVAFCGHRPRLRFTSSMSNRASILQRALATAYRSGVPGGGNH